LGILVGLTVFGKNDVVPDRDAGNRRMELTYNSWQKRGSVGQMGNGIV